MRSKLALFSRVNHGHAGVSNGTFYNRFPAREDLSEAVFAERLEVRAALVAHALADDDPWRGFVGHLTAICELQAADRGFNEVVARGLPPSRAAKRLQEERQAAITRLMDRAMQAGALRDDVTVEDLAFVVCRISRTGSRSPRSSPVRWLAPAIARSAASPDRRWSTASRSWPPATARSTF